MSKDAELFKDKSKCPHIVVATPGRLNALVQPVPFQLFILP
jgi:ATP-dependent RNA helicase UAP56/SUB2